MLRTLINFTVAIGSLTALLLDVVALELVAFSTKVLGTSHASGAVESRLTGSINKCVRNGLHFTPL